MAGLENILGLPETGEVLKAMERECTEGAVADKEFEAYNGALRTTTPRQEWLKILPQGRDGAINPFTYDGTDKTCDDLMKHPMVIEAKLTKYEVVGLKLYTGTPCLCRPHGLCASAPPPPSPPAQCWCGDVIGIVRSRGRV
jgi:hypothetical protein